MRQVVYVLLFMAMLGAWSACKENDFSPTDADFNDPNWIRLEVPAGRAAYAIAGDIDDTLLVTTWTKAYYTTDRGNTWYESKNFHGPVPGLFVRADTIFSLEGMQTDSLGYPVRATIAQYFTVDYGKTWDNYRELYGDDIIQTIGSVTSPSGITYQIKHHRTLVTPGFLDFYVNPSEIVTHDGFNEQPFGFPFQHALNNLYLDARNRLYVATSGGDYVAEHNTFYCCTEEMPAIVYVSRQPVR